MWLYLLCGATLLIAYVLHTLLTTSGSSYGGNSLEAFISHEGDPETDQLIDTSADRYLVNYTDPGKQVLVMFGTEYGCSEEVAKKLFDSVASLRLDGSGARLQPRLVNAQQHSAVDWSQECVLLLVISTSGDGVPPTDARDFYDWMLGTQDVEMSHLHYSVLALGDSNYPHFCRTGRSLDKRLTDLRATQLVPRSDVDQEDWSVIDSWVDAVLDVLPAVAIETKLDYLSLDAVSCDQAYNRTRPFMATMMVKRNLTVQETEEDKETIHCEFDLTGSGLTFTAGDALGIYPQNNPAEVRAVLKALQASGTEMVVPPTWVYQPQPAGKICLEEALIKYYDLKHVNPELVKLLTKHTSDKRERIEGERLLKDGLSKSNIVLWSYLQSNEVVDVLKKFHRAHPPLHLLLSKLKGLQPRYYSIASSPVLDPEKASITAAVLRYSLHGIPRAGVTTTYLQDRLQVNHSCPVFISQNPDFRLPSNNNLSIIMIGPGTGIAPFMAFIQERVATSASGDNLLYFGCQHRNKDFLYKNELETWAKNGSLRLRVAFSRDQDKKVYVQDLLRKDAKEILRHLQNGAHIYVCGDARHMAHDVHQALTDICQEQGDMDSEQARTFLLELEHANRYQKDVWVT
ncbi:PREDICTED: NADPH oxidoreductase A-like [Branchiostoma belcheri]|uniref:NADPH oxidoreductase A-like n=1 Tax=Branchiostoma belcheri TaxID=7741 RepID=A0A6P5AW57_BRABE|nr:PREDICTED: NADPH oxidoreductase A-like [Branchiostoma belcheri]